MVHQRSGRRGFPSPRMAALLLSPALFTTGCDLPTTLPVWEPLWTIPAENTSLTVEQFLPLDVTTEGDSLFRVTPDPFVVRASLGDLCSRCSGLGGVVIPTPPLRGSFENEGALPEDVLGVTLRSGAVVVGLRNGLGFDPLRPGPGLAGSITVTLRSGSNSGRVVGTTVFRGSEIPFPSGGQITRTVSLVPGAVEDVVVGTVTMDTPAGAPARVSGSDFIQVTLTPGVLRVSDALLDLRGRPLDLDPLDLDVEDIDEVILDRIERGRLEVATTNPFGVSADFVVRLSAPGGGAVDRDLRVPPGDNTLALDYSGDELRRFLGRSGARLTGTGTVDTTAAPATVRPGDEAVFRSNFTLALTLGG